MAKRYAEISGKSLSQLVADYFSLLGSKPTGQSELTPKVKALKGALKNVSEDDYRRYLEEKHR
jgi:hypothetical protein